MLYIVAFSFHINSQMKALCGQVWRLILVIYLTLLREEDFNWGIGLIQIGLVGIPGVHLFKLLLLGGGGPSPLSCLHRESPKKDHQGANSWC